jgi:hypothetical protein
MMNTTLNFAHNSVSTSTFSANQYSTLNANAEKKTLAELSHRDRVAIVSSWIDETPVDANFMGSVTFRENENSLKSSASESLIKVCENIDWQLAISTDYSVSDFSTLLIAKQDLHSLRDLNEDTISSLARIIAIISTRYDNLMMATVGLSIKWWSSKHEAQHLYATISPVISSQQCRFGAQRFMFSDFTPEQAARRLGNLSDIHFRDIFPE